MTYKIMIAGPLDYTIFDTTTFTATTLDNFTPDKLFTNDIFTIQDGVVNIVSSSVRNDTMSGVLCLRNNKTYGRTKNGRLLYKCIPDDKRIPAFLVPYDIKSLGFSKVYVNQYVVIKFVEWNDKHPIGMITINIGPVNIIDNFYEYQLYCKSLNSSIQKFNKDTTISLQNTTHDEFIANASAQHKEIEQRIQNWKIFTIDPANTTDYDDGFSIQPIQNTTNHLLSIYITNVTICMDALQLWESFSRRISTIYLPNKKRPMLPTILSECLCSLIAGHKRIAFVMDIVIDENYEIVDVSFKNCLIQVHKNYVYEEHSLLSNPDYQLLMNITQRLSVKYKYMSNVRNSHDLVCYLMICMNYHSAKRMIVYNNGIFRSAVLTTKHVSSDNADMPEEVSKFIKIWNSSSCQYIDLAKGDTKSINHELLDMDAYIQITSPIRRLVDLLNMIQLQQNIGLVKLTEKASEFYNRWVNEIDYINVTMKAIRKVQTHCSLMDVCVRNMELLDKKYDGYLFDKICRHDGQYQYVVYLAELKLTYRITLKEDIPYCEKRQFTLFLFSDEDSLKKKIRLQIIE